MTRAVIAMLFLVSAWPQRAAADLTPGAEAIQRAEAQLQQVDAQIDAVRAQQRSLEAELAQLAQRAAGLQGSQSSRQQRELLQLRRRAASVDRARRAQAARLGQLLQEAETQATVLLGLYQSTLRELPDDAALKQRQQALRQRLGLQAPSQASPEDLKRMADQVQRLEQALRRKARQVAQRIRQLRREQTLAQEVMATVQDQALFDEADRNLSVSQVVRRATQTQRAAQGDTGKQSGAEGSANPGTVPAADYGDSDSRGAEDDGDGNMDPGDGVFNDGETGSYGGGAPPPAAEGGGGVPNGSGTVPPFVPPAATGLSYQSQTITGERVNTLVAQDVDALLRGGATQALSPDEELRRLEGLRLELLRSADAMARQRSEVEARARDAR